jgi:hypothetical protein
VAGEDQAEGTMARRRKCTCRQRLLGEPSSCRHLPFAFPEMPPTRIISSYQLLALEPQRVRAVQLRAGNLLAGQVVCVPEKLVIDIWAARCNYEEPSQTVNWVRERQNQPWIKSSTARYQVLSWLGSVLAASASERRYCTDAVPGSPSDISKGGLAE